MTSPFPSWTSTVQGQSVQTCAVRDNVNAALGPADLRRKGFELALRTCVKRGAQYRHSLSTDVDVCAPQLLRPGSSRARCKGSDSVKTTHPICPPTDVFLVPKLAFLVKIFAVYSRTYGRHVGYEPEGRQFESVRAHHIINKLGAVGNGNSPLCSPTTRNLPHRPQNVYVAVMASWAKSDIGAVTQDTGLRLVPPHDVDIKSVPPKQQNESDASLHIPLFLIVGRQPRAQSKTP